MKSTQLAVAAGLTILAMPLALTAQVEPGSQLAQSSYALTGLHTDAAVDALSRDDFGAAETHARAALQLNPSDERAQLVIADVFENTGRPLEAQAVYQTLALTGTPQPVTDAVWAGMRGMSAKDIAQAKLSGNSSAPALTSGSPENSGLSSVMVDESAVPGSPAMLVPPPDSNASGNGSERVPLGAFKFDEVGDETSMGMAPVSVMGQQSTPNVSPPASRQVRENSVEISRDIPMREESVRAVRPINREFIPQRQMAAITSGQGMKWDMPMREETSNTIERFRLLDRLLEEGLITQAEYSNRRSSNIGAILQYSTDQRPAQNLDRPVPDGDGVVGRLTALRRSLQMRAITPRQHELERAMILDALLSAGPRTRARPEPPPETLFDAAARVGRLEGFRAEGLITNEEFEQEREAIMSLVGVEASTRTQSEVSSDQSAAASVERGTASGDSVAHLASYKSEAAARSGWAVLERKFKTSLSGKEPIIRRVSVPGKGTFYRLMAGPMARTEVVSLCGQLKRSNQYCDVLPL